MTKLIIAFRNFANAPKKHEIYIYKSQESQRVTLHLCHIYVTDRKSDQCAQLQTCVLKVQEMSLFQEMFKDI